MSHINTALKGVTGPFAALLKITYATFCSSVAVWHVIRMEKQTHPPIFVTLENESATRSVALMHS